jgi:hypothetical protein
MKSNDCIDSFHLYYLVGKMLSSDRLIIDGFWTGNRAIAHFDTARDYTLQFTVTHTSIHSHVFTTVVW